MDQLKEYIQRKDGSNIISSLGEIDEVKLSEFFDVISKKESSNFWTSVSGAIEEECSKLLKCITEKLDFDQYVSRFTALIRVIHIFMKAQSSRPIEMMNIVNSMSSLLTAIDTVTISINSFKNSLSLLCESLYISNELRAEENLPDVISYLLIEALKPNSKESTLKRLSTIRHGFKVLDLQGTSSQFTKELIVRCFVHPSFLKSADGHKLLSCLLSVSEGFLINPVISIIKSQVASGSKSLATEYGCIIFKTWKDEQPISMETMPSTKLSRSNLASKSNVTALLEDSIQSLLHDGIHAADSKYFKGLRVLLKAFHDVKRSEALDDMLTRIFEPIIWRSLRCANALVRSQAAMLFLDVFPLQKVTSNPEEADAILQKQFDQLTSLLKDGDQRVRATAVTGVCHILKSYWDVLPPGAVHNLLKYICDTLSVDSASGLVRVAVISGICDLLEQPLSHNVIKMLMPLLAKSLNDKSDKVRHCFIKLLNQIKSIRDLHFYEIVPVDLLLDRLVEDRDNIQITTAITGLLLNSFYPTVSGDNQDNQKGALEIVQRCLKFVEQHEVAAQVFYGALHLHVSIGSVSKLAVMLFNVITAQLQQLDSATTTVGDENQSGNANKVKRRRNQQQQKEEDKLPSPDSLAKSKKVLSSVSRVINAILKSLSSRLREEQPSLDLLYKYFTPSSIFSWTVGVAQLPDLTVLGDTLEAVSTLAKLGSAEYIALLGKELSFDMVISDILPVVSAVPSAEIKSWLFASIISYIWAMNWQVLFIETLGTAFATNSKAKKNNLQEVRSASKVLGSLNTLLCNPVFGAEINSETAKAIDKLWGSVSDWCRVAAAGSSANASIPLELYLEVKKVLMTWSMYQSASELLLSGDREVADSSHFLGNFIREWDDPIDTLPTYFPEANLLLLVLTDMLHLVDESHIPSVVQNIVSVIEAMQRRTGVDQRSNSQFAMLIDRIWGLIQSTQSSVGKELVQRMAEAIVAISDGDQFDSLLEGKRNTISSCHVFVQQTSSAR